MTAVSTACPIIRSFPAGNDLWRIDWFGQVGYPDRLLRNSQPSVCVHLSIVDPDIPILQQTTCWVSIGTLVLLRIGDLWQNQRLVRPNPAALTTLNDVDVASDPEFIKAGASENGHFLLPLAPHPWHKGSTHSYCIRLRLDDDRHLIVPCMELVRFYFGSSSQLLRLLFRPELRRQHLYNPKTSVVSPDRPHCHINLAPDIPARSAPDVARVAGDREAWRWAARIGSSLAAPHNNGHVRTSFPLSGQTTLQARGVWLPLVANGVAGEYQVIVRMGAQTATFTLENLAFPLFSDGFEESSTGRQGFSGNPNPCEHKGTRAPPGFPASQRRIRH